MELTLIAILAAVAGAIAGASFRRFKTRRRSGVDVARNVEAERIIAMLSARQPGVWDVDDLRDRIAETARDLWSLSTRDDMARLQTWVHADLLEETLSIWPARAIRREVRVTFRGQPAFIHVAEGGDDDDRLIARLDAACEGAYMDAKGRRLKRDHRPLRSSYHHWVHIDGQGWRLDSIALQPPTSVDPPSSVSCRILPQDVEDPPAVR